MRPVLPIAGAMLALAGWSLAAQVATNAAAAGPPPSLKSVGLIIYPAKKQTPQQQATDEAECAGLEVWRGVAPSKRCSFATTSMRGRRRRRAASRSLRSLAPGR